MARLSGRLLCGNSQAHKPTVTRCLVLLRAGSYQKSSLKRRKMTCWTLNREYRPDNNFSVTLVYGMAVKCLYFSLLRLLRKKQMLVIAGLLNVKTADERCIRSVCCTTTSFGHQGTSHSDSRDGYKRVMAIIDLNWIHSAGIAAC